MLEILFLMTAASKNAGISLRPRSFYDSSNDRVCKEIGTVSLRD